MASKKRSLPEMEEESVEGVDEIQQDEGEEVESDDTDIGAEDECLPEQVAAAPAKRKRVTAPRTGTVRKSSRVASSAYSSFNQPLVSKVTTASAVAQGKRRAAAQAGQLIHACSTTGLMEARVVSAHKRAIDEKNRARRRAAMAAAKAAAEASGEPAPKRPRRSASKSSLSGAKSAVAGKKKSATATTAAANRKKKTGTAKSTPASKTKGRTTIKRKTPASAAKGAAKRTPALKKGAKKTPATPKRGTKKSPALRGTRKTSATIAKKPVAKKATPAAPKKLSPNDAYVKFEWRLSNMPASAFKQFHNKWLSIYDTTLRKRSSFKEGHFGPKWCCILAKVAEAKGYPAKGALPHYTGKPLKTEDGEPVMTEDGIALKLFEKMPHIVEAHMEEVYKGAGFDKVEGGRVYVGLAKKSAGIMEDSPFAMLHVDSVDDVDWRALKKQLDQEEEEQAEEEEEEEEEEVDILAPSGITA